MSLLFITVLLGFVAATANAQLVEPSASQLEEMDGKIEKYMSDSNIPGGLIAVAQKGEIIELRTYGLSNVELSIPVSAGHVFEIGSISKQFVATMALQLVEEGKLSLDDPIHKHLPELPSSWVGVTLKQLLNHTSGIPDYEEIYTYDIYRLRVTPQEVIKIANGRPMDFEPGQGWYYSNTGYYLASMIVERVAGMPLGKAMKQRIFDPLGMTSTRFADPEAIIKGRAEGYWVNKKGELINRNATETSSTLGAGGLLSSAADMAKWDAALYGTEILSEASKKIMWQSTVLPDGTDMEYALGWNVAPERGMVKTGHSGQVAGFVAYFARYTDHETAIIVFLNRYRVSSGHVRDIVLDTFMPSTKE